jgi:hypothetical protein
MQPVTKISKLNPSNNNSKRRSLLDIVSALNLSFLKRCSKKKPKIQPIDASTLKKPTVKISKFKIALICSAIPAVNGRRKTNNFREKRGENIVNKHKIEKTKKLIQGKLG